MEKIIDALIALGPLGVIVALEALAIAAVYIDGRRQNTKAAEALAALVDKHAEEIKEIYEKRLEDAKAMAEIAAGNIESGRAVNASLNALNVSLSAMQSVILSPGRRKQQ